MNVFKQMSILQRIISRQANSIKECESAVHFWRQAKNDADESGSLLAEQQGHNELVSIRKYLAALVEDQKYLKLLLKALKKPKVSKKHPKKEV